MLRQSSDLVKYFPALEYVPNKLIPYINFVLAVLMKLVAPVDAQAAGFFSGLGHSLGWALPVVQVLLAHLLHEALVRPGMEYAKGVVDSASKS